MTKKKIGLALSGGGARGFAHVGVIKALDEHGIRFDMIAGSSAGSVVGAALAAGMTAAGIETMARKVGWLNTMRPAFSIRGLLSTAPMGKFLGRELPVSRFEDLAIPFATVAYDLAKGEEVVFRDSGDLVHAIRSSCAVPGIFTPMTDMDGRVLVDAGVTSVIPTDVVWAMGADVVIAIDLLACGATYPSAPKSGFGILVRSALTVIRTASKNQKRPADIVIEPRIAHLRPDQIAKCDEFIKLGEAAALEKIDEIERLLDLQ